MPLVLKKRSADNEYQPLKNETLASIAQHRCDPGTTWKMIAHYNWGTVEPDEVVRAMAETVGILIEDVFDAWGKLKAKPEEVKFDPDADLPKKINLPQKIDAKSIDMEKRHEVRVKTTKPAVAVRITKLDKWFIPEAEKCDVAYAFEGLAENATKAQLDIYGSNYTWCSDYKKGVGEYTDPKPFDKIPLFTEDDKVEPKERGDGKFKWTGEVTTAEGMLKHKMDGRDKRYVNVAFSPYTAQMRYWKADGDKDAQLQLLPFWPLFETKKTTINTVRTFAPSEANATSVKFAYTNDDDVEGGWLTVVDAGGQLVWRRALKDDELKKGAREIDWDGTYHKLALNGVMKPELINDLAKSDDEIRTEGYLFRSWPYVYTLETYKRAYRTAGDADTEDPSQIKWKLREASKLERGLIQIFDKDGKLVWVKGLPKSKLSAGAEHKVQWDGKYAAGVKNSKDKEEAIEADMPYRVQIQVHRKENEDDGLALAAMHSEVRLYVPKGLYAPKDPRRDLIATPPAMQISRAKIWPRDDPPAGETTLYYQWALNNAGFHAGPVSDVDNDHLKRAIREFKRSVPRDIAAAAGAFKRHSLADAVKNDPTPEMTACLSGLTDRYKRRIWGLRQFVDAFRDHPYPTENWTDHRLADPESDLIIWVDDRQYYTDPGAIGATHGFGPKGVDMLGRPRPPGARTLAAGAPYNDVDPDATAIEEARDWGLRNYRQSMSVGDQSVTFDNAEISQPWISLKAELRLLSRKDDLHPDADKDKVVVKDSDLRAAMRRAIGPIRVDWSVHDALYDVTTIDSANYPQSGPQGPGEIRTRRYVAGALVAAKRRHKRKDEEFHEQLWNCRKTPHDVGKVPDDMRTYHREVFAQGDDDSLRPWAAIHHDDEEATASIVHDHVVELKDGDGAQKLKETLIEPAIGAAGIWFNPAIAAGDGYRLRAEVKFKEVGDYKLPNLKTLAARYPVLPQATTCELRMWRRSTLRGYAKWSPAAEATRWTSANLNQIRRQYMTGHVYVTFDGSTDTLAGLNKSIATMFNNFGADEQATLRKFAKWGGADDWVADIDQVVGHQDYSWPWHQRPDLGRPDGAWASNAAGYAGEVGTYLGQFDDPQWDKMTGAVLYWIHSKFEADGHMRGHMMIDFKDAPATRLWKYTCTANPDHIYYQLRRQDAGAPFPAADPCHCGATPMTRQSFDYGGGVFLAAIGLAGGASWLFPGDGDLWTHEIGHHKHLQHAASAPGAQNAQHDSGRNAAVPGATAAIMTPGGSNAQELGWDRRCIMTYNDRDGGSRLFCGKCVMRNRGWKYGSVADAAADVTEPA